MTKTTNFLLQQLHYKTCNLLPHNRQPTPHSTLNLLPFNPQPTTIQPSTYYHSTLNPLSIPCSFHPDSSSTSPLPSTRSPLHNLLSPLLPPLSTLPSHLPLSLLTTLHSFIVLSTSHFPLHTPLSRQHPLNVHGKSPQACHDQSPDCVSVVPHWRCMTFAKKVSTLRVHTYCILWTAHCS